MKMFFIKTSDVQDEFLSTFAIFLWLKYYECLKIQIFEIFKSPHNTT